MPYVVAPRAGLLADVLVSVMLISFFDSHPASWNWRSNTRWTAAIAPACQRASESVVLPCGLVSGCEEDCESGSEGYLHSVSIGECST